MIKNTQLIEKATDVQSSRRTRKLTVTDVTDFAQLLSSRELQSSGRTIFGTSDRREATGVSSETQSRTEVLGGGKSRRAAKSPAERNKEIDHPASDDGSDNAQGPLQTTESGQTQQGRSAESVDGCENGVQPGTSTEATVNAQHEEASDGQTSPKEPDARTASASEGESGADGSEPVSDMLQEILNQMDLTASGPVPDMADAAELKISATNIGQPNPVFAANMNLADQAIFFESGLAEHFIRALTDQFDQVKSTAKGDESGAAVQSISMNASSGQAGKGTLGAAATMPQTAVPDEKNVDSMNRIIQVLRSNLGRRQSQMTVRLDPPELGRLRMDVKLTDNNLRLYVVTETAEARQIIMDRIETLRGSLEQSGITMSKFEVVTREFDSSGQNWPSPQDYQHAGGGFQRQSSGESGSQKFSLSGDSPAEDVEGSVITIPTVSSPDAAVNVVA